ncbi:MAG: alpha/beta hydrolase-fold protein [Candidatus Dormiibacterota bacterium]
MVEVLSSSPLVFNDKVVFQFPDPGGRVKGVVLYQEVQWPRSGPAFQRRGTGFWAELPRPPVDRMEYNLQVSWEDGGFAWIPDPQNQLRTPTPYGDKSVVEFPSYRPPQWVGRMAGQAGDITRIRLNCPSLGGTMEGELWSSAGSRPEEQLPLLLVLDGGDYQTYTGITQMLDRAVADGRLPPLRAALLCPVRREADYAASPTFANCLADEVLPGLGELVALAPGPRMRVGMGASLGALALLHAHWRRPDVLGGLFLQSTSFVGRVEAERSSLEHAARMAEFTDAVVGSRSAPPPVLVAMTCGVVEEILLANIGVAATLSERGYPVSMCKLADGHNWIAWRDAFDPHLIDLLARVFLGD